MVWSSLSWICECTVFAIGYQSRAPLVSLIIPTRNGLRLLRRCFESILEKTTYQHYEIVLVDNGSDDPETLRYLESIQGDSRVRIIRDNRPFNYSQLINSAVTSASGDGDRFTERRPGSDHTRTGSRKW